jgi:hypothetical protein
VQKVSRVVAFEPEQECFARLEQNIRINDLPNISAYCKALGDREAEEVLYMGDGVGAINSGQLGTDWTAGARQTISIVQGDVFRQMQNLPPPRTDIIVLFSALGRLSPAHAGWAFSTISTWVILLLRKIIEGPRFCG